MQAMDSEHDGQRKRVTAQLKVSWDNDIDTYLKCQGNTPSSVRNLRTRLAEAVKRTSESPEAWWAFLQQEESTASGNTATLSGSNRGGVSLFDLYVWATKKVPRQSNYKNEAYLRIWLGYARQQWLKNKDDARDTFKTLRSQHIGDQSAFLYYEWAALEHLAGNDTKAISVLQKGLREQAQPAGILEQMQQEVQQQKFVYRPPWMTGGTTTGHSNGSTYAAFLTPGGLEHRRSAATPTFEANQDSQLAGTTETLVLTKPAGAVGKSEQQQREGKEMKEQDTVIIQARSRAAGSLADQYNRTFTSTSTGSGESTAPLRMSTPRTGLSNHSGSTAGSIGEEATVSLRKPSGNGPDAGGVAGGDHVRAGIAGCGKGANDETMIVNRASVHKAQDGQAKDSSLPKPRRMGMLGLGRALRVTPGGPPQDSQASAAADTSTEEPDAANRKRKAEADAVHSPLLLEQAAEHKRRSPITQEPEADAAKTCAELPLLPPRQRPLPPVPRFDSSKPPLPTTTPAPSGSAAGPADAASAEHRTAALARVNPAAVPRKQVVLRERGGGQGGSDDETVPHVMSKLAQKIAKGRQSLAPGKVVLRADGAVVGHGETSTSLGSHDSDNAPTAPTERGGGDGASSRPEEDPETTRPLARPASVSRPSPPRPAVPSRQLQIDGSGNVKLSQQSQPSSRPNAVPVPRRMPVPPPPPPATAHQDEARPAVTHAAAPPQHRLPMGPPAPVAPKHLRGQPGGEHRAGGQEAAQPRRRVIEDENTIVVKGIAYTKLECVGRGGSSKVYKVMAPNRKIFALKRIRLTGRDSEAASGFLDEITLLNKLHGRSNIIQLIDSEVFRSEGIIYMVLECGDIDLARLLQKHEKARQEHVNADELDENFIRLYWEQMLQAVYSIHEQRIVHSDLKPANFLMVEGQLKLIDFGIAKAIQADTTSIARESQVGTLNYMSPEAILGGQNNIRGGPPMKVGRPSDVWSLGCILYQMVYGHTPFSHLPFIQKMHAIIDPNHRVSFPPIRNKALMDVMQRCLDRDPRSRITMKELLDHPFLRPTYSSHDTGGAGSAGEVRLSQQQLTKLLVQMSKAGVSDTEVNKLSEELFRQMSNGLSPNILATRAASFAALAQQPPSYPGPSEAQQGQAAGGSRRGSAAAAATAAETRASASQSSRAAEGGGLLPARSPAGEGPVEPAATVCHRQQQEQRAARAAPAPRAQPASVAEAAAQAAAARSQQRAAAVAAVDARPKAAAQPSRVPLAPVSQSAILQQAAALRKVDPAAQRAVPQQQEGGLEAALRKGLEKFKFDDTRGTTAHGDDTTGDFSVH